MNNWHVARVAAERELTTDMLGTQRKCVTPCLRLRCIHAMCQHESHLRCPAM